MQLYALDSSKKYISAEDSRKQTDYFCPECESILRVRSGIHRRKHFYHLHKSSTCRQNSKSAQHLHVQMHLQKLFGDSDCQLEVRFPHIKRIADVVYFPQKLIFEVQCSPISAQEVRERNTDYAKEGYLTIWILHDRCFKKKRYSGAELFLITSPHYYTNIDENGDGFFYDVFSIFDKGSSALESIKGVWDPDYSSYSLGLYRMLLEEQYGQENNFKYYYPGYIAPGCPSFDYKRCLS